MLDFPNSPTTGQIFTAGGGAWKWDSTKWIGVPAGTVGDITGVAAGAGLSGGGASGDVTLALTIPVSLSNGGTNATSAAAALTSLGAYPASNPSGYVTGGPYLPTAGGSMTGAIVTPNNAGIFQARESGGTARTLAYMGSDNQIYFGGGSNPVQLWATALAATCNLDLPNNNALRGKDTGGTARQLAMLASDNQVYIGDGARTVVINTGVSPNQIYCTGGASKPGGGVFADNSDIRLKRNVTDYSRGLDAVVQLRPVYFEFNGKAETPTGQTFIGLVADEVEPVMPEMTGTREALLNPDDAEPVEVKTLDCTALIFALVNSVKALTARIEALEARP